MTLQLLVLTQNTSIQPFKCLLILCWTVLANNQNKTKEGDVGNLPVSIQDISREDTKRPPFSPVGDKTVAAASIISVNQTYGTLQHRSECGYTPSTDSHILVFSCFTAAP